MARADAAPSLIRWPRISRRAIAGIVAVNLLLLLYQSYAEQIFYGVIFPATVSQVCLLAARHRWYGSFRLGELAKTCGGLLAWAGFYHLVVPQSSGFGSLGETIGFFGMLGVCVLIWRMVLTTCAPQLLREKFTIRSGLECTALAGLAFAVSRWWLDDANDFMEAFSYMAILWMPLTFFFLLTQAALAHRAWRSLGGVVLLTLGCAITLEWITQGKPNGFAAGLYLLVIAYTIGWWFLAGGLTLPAEPGGAAETENPNGGQLQAG